MWQTAAPVKCHQDINIYSNLDDLLGHYLLFGASVAHCAFTSLPILVNSKGQGMSNLTQQQTLLARQDPSLNPTLSDNLLPPSS